MLNPQTFEFMKAVKSPQTPGSNWSFRALREEQTHLEKNIYVETILHLQYQ